MRGFLCFVVSNEEKVVPVLGDASPEALGVDTLVWLRTYAPFRTGLREKLRALRMFSPGEYWPADEVERDRIAVELRAKDAMMAEDEALRPGVIAAGPFARGEWSLASSSYEISWGYVVDVDRGEFGVYRGGQRFEHGLGRFRDRPRLIRDWWPPKLVTTWPLGGLPTDQQFVRAVEECLVD